MEEEGAPSQGGGGGGGGDKKASDGTGTSDHKGRDIVNGVETWKDEKTGEIRVEIDRNTSQEVDKSPKSLETKKAIKDHWNKVSEKDTNVEVNDTISKGSGEKNGSTKIAEGDSLKIVEKASKKSLAEGSSSPQVPNSPQKELETDKVNENLEEANFIVNRAGDVSDLISDASQKGQKDVESDLNRKKQIKTKYEASKVKVPSKLEKAIGAAEDTLKKVDKWIKGWDIGGKVFDVVAIGLSIIKAIRIPTPENIFDAVYDAFTTALSYLVTFGSWVISIISDSFKESELYHDFRKTILGK